MSTPLVIAPMVIAGLPVQVRQSAQAQRLTLRLDPSGTTLRVVTPPRVSAAEVRRFVERHEGWVQARLAALPVHTPFVVGAEVPIGGVPHIIRHDPAYRGPVGPAEGSFLVGGQAEFLTRRVRDWLMRAARRDISAHAHPMAARLGVRINAITLRDTRSRWGSCSTSGRLSFSWRLILAPATVLEYVVAHEVAHLREMNHSPRFWGLCAQLVPEIQAPRSWLRRNGARLLRYG